MTVNSPIIVALDYPDLSPALAMADQLDPNQCRVKVGKELFTRAGPQAIEQLTRMGFEIFLDLKFHDIPNTVAKACRAAADWGVWMLTLHSLGGPAMLEAARKALPNDPKRPLLVAVTLLTSMDTDTLLSLGITTPLTEQVLRLAHLAQQANLDGVVCSAQEAPQLRQQMPTPFKLVTPGIRLEPTPNDDQKRTCTPSQALAQGSDFLVIGRPITQSRHPLNSLETLTASLRP